MKNILVIALLFVTGCCCLPIPSLPPGQRVAEVEILGSVVGEVEIGNTGEYLPCVDVVVRDTSNNELYLVAESELPDGVKKHDVITCIVDDARFLNRETLEIGRPTVHSR